MRGKEGKEEKPDPHRQGHAVFFLRPALALSFVDSGSGMGLKLGSRAIRLRSDSSLRIVGIIAHFIYEDVLVHASCDNSRSVCCSTEVPL